MRAMALAVGLVVLAGCDSSERRLRDLSWGKSFQADYSLTLERARYVLLNQFPKGFDPDRTDEEGGDFWTVWHHEISPFYLKTNRFRAHVKIEPVAEGRVRIGVAVVRQYNDNIDNPSVISEARWVRTTRDNERASLLERSIARRYTQVKPSEFFEEKHRATPRKSLRPDIVDRNRDVDLEEFEKEKRPPPITGDQEHDRKSEDD